VIEGLRVGAQRDGPESLARTGWTSAPDETFDRFATMVRRVLDVPVALVTVVEPDRQCFLGASGLDEPWNTERQTPLSHSFCRLVVATAGPLVVADAREDPRVRDNPAIDALGVVAYAGMPLTDVHGNVLGSLCAIDHTPRRWTDDELRLLADLAAACSDSLRLRISSEVAERGRREADEARQRLRMAFNRSQVLLNASVALTATGTIAEVVTAVGKLVTGALDPVDLGIALFDPDAAEVDPVDLGIALFDPDAAEEHGTDLHTVPPMRGGLAEAWAALARAAVRPAADAARKGQPFVLADRQAIADALPDVDGLEDHGWHAIAGAPLRGPDGPIGVLTVAWRHPHEIEPDELAVVTTLAGYVAQAVRRATDLEQRTTAATVLQRALLTAVPTIGGLDLAARYVPAHSGDLVGGDWYDVIACPDGRVALVVGDVCGHSLDAAATMSELRSMLRGYLVDRVESPSRTLTRLDAACFALGQVPITTAVLAVLEPDPAGGHLLTWSNAGHPPATVLAPGAPPVLLGGSDLLLGATSGVTRHDHSRVLPPGSTVVLHTDGLVERRNSGIDEGFADLHDALGRHRHLRPADLADLLIDRIPASDRDDDIAFLIIRTMDG
jgi:serine phosphatase RsbU (regulator of sigma subunit)